MGLQNVSGKNFCLLGFILHSANRKTNSEREVIVVLVTQDAEDNGKKNKGSSCCLNVKRPHRFTSLNTWSPAVALFGKDVEATGSGVCWRK